MLRLAIIGLGNIGQAHACAVLSGAVPRLRLAAVCDADASRRALFPDAAGFATPAELLATGKSIADLVIVATPHPSHVELGIQVLRAGLHLLMEKPLGVHVADARRLLDVAACAPGRFGVMLNQRTDPLYQRVRQLVRGGELGAVHRIAWTVTDWFRTQAYYRTAAWRGTWAGEGGGLLLNQCPHNLDLLQWIFGMPASVHAHACFGRYHDIEVEDDISVFIAYPNSGSQHGATGIFTASTGEAPGVNRLEVFADNGLVTVENRTLRWQKTSAQVSAFCRETPEVFGRPAVSEIIERFSLATVEPHHRHGEHAQHIALMSDFVTTILEPGAPGLAPGADGIGSLELANAMLLSALEHRPVSLPLDAACYTARIEGLVKGNSP
ncbi:Gfo/Idh/MocA family protein [Geminisphaera colitermitum]|uniref:Gfo/Idh/MocA family protein n=1 Tax=Geminisphaera colitermitum TaxID=1148786 RepID=UPI000158D46B|nr:Gfo/Idh/MocA family oxidoreductase [Geminisphaera colitermitum]